MNFNQGKLQAAFHLIDPTRQGQCLLLQWVVFTRVEEAQMVHEFVQDIMQSHPLALRYVKFFHCLFQSDDDESSLNILKDLFAIMKMNNSGIEILVFPRQDEINAAWFPSLTDFATVLDLSQHSLGDSGFIKVVDTILGGNAKNNMQRLCLPDTGISFNSLAVDAATRLVEQSQLKRLDMFMNDGILDIKQHVQSLCDKLKNNKFLLHLDLSWCNASEDTATSTTDMLVDMFTINTTLTRVDLDQNGHPSHNDIHNRHRLETWTRRNKRLATVLAGVQGLLHHPNNNNNNQQQQQQQNANNEENNHIIIANEGSWRLILNAAMEDVDRDRSALYLLMCTAIVGGQDEACPLHDKVVDFLKMSSSSSNSNKDTNKNDVDINSGGGGRGGKRARQS